MVSSTPFTHSSTFFLISFPQNLITVQPSSSSLLLISSSRSWLREILPTQHSALSPYLIVVLTRPNPFHERIHDHRKWQSHTWSAQYLVFQKCPCIFFYTDILCAIGLCGAVSRLLCLWSKYAACFFFAVLWKDCPLVSLAFKKCFPFPITYQKNFIHIKHIKKYINLIPLLISLIFFSF